MKVLGIETATPAISVALVDDARVLGTREGLVERNRTGVLPIIDELFRELGVAPGDIDAVAIGAGPGSFTGLRIGMATAKGIAFAAHRPLWAVSSLAAIAHVELQRDPSGTVVAVIDARRGEVYAGAYRREGEQLVAVGEERVLPPSDVASIAPGARFAGFGYSDATPTGLAVAQLALAGSRADILVGGAPSYIRPSEAEVKYPDGVPGALRKRT